MSDFENFEVNKVGHLATYKEALEVAIEGLSLLEEDSPIAKKTLEEINKICQKIGKE